jgi:DNA repair exonuclease SbcCD ATPase subunit
MQAVDVGGQVAKLKEACRALEAQLEKEQERSHQLNLQRQSAEQEVDKLRFAVTMAEEMKAKQSQSLKEEHLRLDAEAAAFEVVKAELEAVRSEAAELMQQMSDVRGSTGARIKDALGKERAAREASIEETRSEWVAEKKSLDDRLTQAAAELGLIQSKSSEAAQHVSHLRKRMAAARFGRAAAEWKHRCRVKAMRDKWRRAKAAGLRKLGAEREELDDEVTRRREALNQNIRQTQANDSKIRDAFKAEHEDLKSELQQLEQRIVAAEERKRQKVQLAEVVKIEQISEGERIRRWAEAMSGMGSSSFASASRRLGVRNLVPGLGGHTDEEEQASQRRAGRLEGGMLQLEEQMRDISQPFDRTASKFARVGGGESKESDALFALLQQLGPDEFLELLQKLPAGSDPVKELNILAR